MNSSMLDPRIEYSEIRPKGSIASYDSPRQNSESQKLSSPRTSPQAAGYGLGLTWNWLDWYMADKHSDTSMSMLHVICRPFNVSITFVMTPMGVIFSQSQLSATVKFIGFFFSHMALPRHIQVIKLNAKEICSQ